MRVTQGMITRNALIRVNQNRSNMAETQEHIVTGRRINRASDDPTSFAKAERLKATLQENEQYLNKIKSANSWVTNSVSLLEQMTDISLEARNIANKGADGQSDADIRTVLAGKLDSYINEMLSLNNSQYLGKSVFAGTDTKTANPFIYNAGVVSYIGNDEQITRSYSESVNVTTNITGQQIMDTGIFSAMTDLLTALNANDEVGIRAQMDALKTASEGILALTSEMGARSKNVELIQSRLEQSNFDLEIFLSDERDAKIDEEIVRFKAEEFAYEAALKATLVAMRMSIMQYI
jgi:flagellar hook-associated protein 3 FlgL